MSGAQIQLDQTTSRHLRKELAFWYEQCLKGPVVPPCSTVRHSLKWCITTLLCVQVHRRWCCIVCGYGSAVEPSSLSQFCHITSSEIANHATRLDQARAQLTCPGRTNKAIITHTCVIEGVSYSIVTDAADVRLTGCTAALSVTPAVWALSHVLEHISHNKTTLLWPQKGRTSLCFFRAVSICPSFPIGVEPLDSDRRVGSVCLVPCRCCDAIMASGLVDIQGIRKYGSLRLTSRSCVAPSH